MGSKVVILSHLLSSLQERCVCVADVGEDLLSMCQRNMHLNQRYIAASGNVYDHVKAGK